MNSNKSLSRKNINNHKSVLRNYSNKTCIQNVSLEKWPMNPVSILKEPKDNVSILGQRCINCLKGVYKFVKFLINLKHSVSSNNDNLADYQSIKTAVESYKSMLEFVAGDNVPKLTYNTSNHQLCRKPFETLAFNHPAITSLLNIMNTNKTLFFNSAYKTSNADIQMEYLLDNSQELELLNLNDSEVFCSEKTNEEEDTFLKTVDLAIKSNSPDTVNQMINQVNKWFSPRIPSTINSYQTQMQRCKSNGYGFHEFEKSCKFLYKNFSNNPTYVAHILAENNVIDKHKQLLLDELKTLRQCVEHNSSFDIVEDFARKLYIKSSCNRLDHYSKIYDLLADEKKRILKLRNEELEVYNTHIKKLKLDASIAQKLFVEWVARAKEDDDSSTSLINLKLQKVKDTFQKGTFKKTYAKLQVENWQSEKNLHHVKNKLKTEIIALHSKYKNEMAIYENQIKQEISNFDDINTDISYLYKTKQNEFVKIINENKDIFWSTCKHQMEIINKENATVKIQNWWRNYVVKKNKKSLSPLGEKVLNSLNNAIKNVTLICSLKTNLKKIKDCIDEGELKNLLKELDEIYTYSASFYKVLSLDKPDNILPKSEIFCINDSSSEYEDLIKCSRELFKTNLKFSLKNKKSYSLEIFSVEKCSLFDNIEENDDKDLIADIFKEENSFTQDDFINNLNFNNPEVLFKKFDIYTSFYNRLQDTNFDKSFQNLEALRGSSGLTRPKLTQICKNILRCLNKMYNFENFIFASEIKNDIGNFFLKELNKLVNIYSHKYHLSPIEEFGRRLYIKSSHHRLKHYSNLICVLSDERKIINAEQEQKIKALNEAIRNLKLIADTTQKVLSENINRITEQELFSRLAEEANFVTRKKINRISSTMGNKLWQHANWEKEYELRRMKFKARRSLEDIKYKYNNEISNLEKEMKNVMIENSVDENKINSFKNRFTISKNQFIKILLQRSLETKVYIEKRNMLMFRNESATKIQTWWRKIILKKQLKKLNRN
ncbi:hypothetical protein HELRODRAFT_163001 [Helobdella robusta]|uniref:Dynein regulatory complex protein 10 n=1 Tax=Helobdella robusta TaxID=6412 RepID=T1ETJ3_HELRO|nr:hypothetical protein HELRODRAFT_163001 [Helobdella robusta]ESN99452.1 hypothetical protein HELRODRAFT_163001 [Helobdella robusta]